MDELLKTLVEQMPSMIGLIVAIVVLYRQNEQLLRDVFKRLDDLERKIEQMADVK